MISSFNAWKALRACPLTPSLLMFRPLMILITCVLALSAHPRSSSARTSTGRRRRRLKVSVGSVVCPDTIVILAPTVISDTVLFAKLPTLTSCASAGRKKIPVLAIRLAPEAKGGVTNINTRPVESLKSAVSMSQQQLHRMTATRKRQTCLRTLRALRSSRPRQEIFSSTEKAGRS